MKNMVFAMELKGKVVPVTGTEHILQAKLAGRGPQAEPVAFESTVILSGNTFNESGSIDYHGYGKLKFETVGVGHLGQSPVAGLQSGVVNWKVTDAQGAFTGATGYITSNFTISAEGDVVDNQYIRLFIP